MAFELQKQQLNDAIAFLSSNKTPLNKAVLHQLRTMVSNKFLRRVVDGGVKVTYIDGDHRLESLTTEPWEVVIIGGDLHVEGDIKPSRWSFIYVAGNTQARYVLRQDEDSNFTNSIYLNGGLSCQFADLSSSESHLNGPFAVEVMLCGTGNQIKLHEQFSAVGKICVTAASSLPASFAFDIVTSLRRAHLHIDERFFAVLKEGKPNPRFDLLLEDELPENERISWQSYHDDKGMNLRLEVNTLLAAVRNGEDVQRHRDPAKLLAATQADAPPRSEKQQAVDAMILAIEQTNNPNLKEALHQLRHCNADDVVDGAGKPVKISYHADSLTLPELHFSQAEVVLVAGDLYVEGAIRLEEYSTLIVLGEVHCELFDGCYDAFIFLAGGMQAKAANFRYPDINAYGCGDFAIGVCISGGGDGWLDILAGSASGDLLLGVLQGGRSFKRTVGLHEVVEHLRDECFAIDEDFTPNPLFDKVHDEDTAAEVLSEDELIEFRENIEQWYDYDNNKLDAYEFDAEQTLNRVLSGKTILR